MMDEEGPLHLAEGLTEQGFQKIRWKFGGDEVFTKRFQQMKDEALLTKNKFFSIVKKPLAQWSTEESELWFSACLQNAAKYINEWMHLELTEAHLEEWNRREQRCKGSVVLPVLLTCRARIKRQGDLKRKAIQDSSGSIRPPKKRGRPRGSLNKSKTSTPSKALPPDSSEKSLPKKHPRNDYASYYCWLVMCPDLILLMSPDQEGRLEDRKKKQIRVRTQQIKVTGTRAHLGQRPCLVVLCCKKPDLASVEGLDDTPEAYQQAMTKLVLQDMRDSTLKYTVVDSITSAYGLLVSDKNSLHHQRYGPPPERSERKSKLAPQDVAAKAKEIERRAKRRNSVKYARQSGDQMWFVCKDMIGNFNHQQSIYPKKQDWRLLAREGSWGDYMDAPYFPVHPEWLNSVPSEEMRQLVALVQQTLELPEKIPVDYSCSLGNNLAEILKHPKIQELKRKLEEKAENEFVSKRHKVPQVQ